MKRVYFLWDPKKETLDVANELVKRLNQIVKETQKDSVIQTILSKCNGTVGIFY